MFIHKAVLVTYVAYFVHVCERASTCTCIESIVYYLYLYIIHCMFLPVQVCNMKQRSYKQYLHVT